MTRSKFSRRLVGLANRAFAPLGYQVAEERQLVDVYLHEYQSYEQYRDAQIHHNKRKLSNIWADDVTLDRVAALVLAQDHGEIVRGLCHGTRNGFEQNYLIGANPGFEVIGTDISDTAETFENSLHWDFHDAREDWIGAFDFIYSNSLDQSWKPRAALTVWLNQVRKGGIVIIEHSESHGPGSAGEMDPFGVRPVAMPYVLTDWFGHQISIAHTRARKGNMKRDAWLFVCRKLVDEAV